MDHIFTIGETRYKITGIAPADHPHKPGRIYAQELDTVYPAGLDWRREVSIDLETPGGPRFTSWNMSVSLGDRYLAGVRDAVTSWRQAAIGQALARLGEHVAALDDAGDQAAPAAAAAPADLLSTIDAPAALAQLDKNADLIDRMRRGELLELVVEPDPAPLDAPLARTVDQVAADVAHILRRGAHVEHRALIITLAELVPTRRRSPPMYVIRRHNGTPDRRFYSAPACARAFVDLVGIPAAERAIRDALERIDPK